jgi:hypothetical protein
MEWQGIEWPTPSSRILKAITKNYYFYIASYIFIDA